MIYDVPSIRPAGDRYALVELGDEMSLELNFLAQGLASAAADAGIAGIIETAPCFASLLIHYEPERIGFSDLTSEIDKLRGALGSSDELVLNSRLFYLPTLYLDPWTKQCVNEYCDKVQQKVWDPQLIADLNGLADVNHFVRTHASSEYWVAALGFWPGLPFMMPLDPRARLTAPKYNPPRTQTPAGALGLGGAANSIYPTASPGGYQIFARTPVPIWDPTRRQPDFGDQVCLFRAGDRIKYIPITLEEYKDVEGRVADGTYRYDVVSYQKFSVRDYKDWSGKLVNRHTDEGSTK